MSPPAGIAVVLGTLGALVLVVKTLRAGGVVSPEGSRKLVHMGMGVVCLSFPWLFATGWPVWTLAALACAGLAALRLVPALKRELGGVLHGVERVSWGELYFPLGVALVFTLAQGRTLLFVIPVAVLTFADAAGALIGRSWGRHRFTTLEGTKTVEGSVAVGIAGLLCTTGPLLLAQRDPVHALLIGALVGFFGALVEAISWRGLDNVFLPLAVFAQIGIYLGLTEGELLARLAALTVIAVAAVVWRRGQVVDDSARLGGALALYFFWAVGRWPWLVAPVILLTCYVRLMPTVPGGVTRHNLVAVVCIASAGLVWCVANAFAPNPAWLWPFTLGLATQQAVIAIVRFSQGRPHWPRLAWWAIGNLQALSLHLLAFWLIDQGRTVNGAGYGWGAAAVALATAGFVLWERQLALPDDLNARWWKQGITGAVAATAGFFMMHL